MKYGWIGTVYLFGFIPIYRGLYAPSLVEAFDWEKSLRLWIKLFVTITWKIKVEEGE